MTGHDVENFFTFFYTTAGAKLVTEHDFFSGVVHLRPEDEAAAGDGTLDCPAGERSCNVDHILLRVTAVDAEGVKLEQLAPVVLVEPAVSELIETLSHLLVLRGIHSSRSPTATGIWHGWPHAAPPARSA